MNYYAKAIEIIASLDRKLSTAETRIAMTNPSVFVVAFSAENLYDVILTDTGPRKTSLIKVVRALTGLGLKEAKEVSESAPIVIVTEKTFEEAYKATLKLQEAGATVEMKAMDKE